MAQLDKDDLAQMNEDYFKSLEKESLVEVAKNLHQLATDLWEKQQRNSENSSQPPSKDNPYTSKPTTEESDHDSELGTGSAETEQKQIDASSRKANQKKSNRKPGKQPGGKGFGRKQPLKAEVIIPHYPHQCSACNHDLGEFESQRYMGYYVLELEATESGFRIVTSLHHYYQTSCSCGHCTRAKPGTGLVFCSRRAQQRFNFDRVCSGGANLSNIHCFIGSALSDESHQDSRVFKRLDEHRTEHRNHRQMYSRSRNCLCASSRRVGRTTANLQISYIWMKPIGTFGESFIGYGWRSVLKLLYFILALAEKKNYPIWSQKPLWAG